MSMMRSSVSIGEMVAQSRDIMANPSVPTFERYERRGTLGNAAVYIAIAAVIAGLLGIVGGIGGVVSGIITTLAGFFVFTGLVYYLGRQMGGGTGTWNEVAYTFSLFSAPLYVIGALVTFVIALFAWIPLLGGLFWLFGLLIALVLLLAQVYFGYLGVQSSMNITDQSRALLVLGLSALGTFVVQMLLAVIF